MYFFTISRVRNSTAFSVFTERSKKQEEHHPFIHCWSTGFLVHECRSNQIDLTQEKPRITITSHHHHHHHKKKKKKKKKSFVQPQMREYKKNEREREKYKKEREREYKKNEREREREIQEE